MKPSKINADRKEGISSKNRFLLWEMQTHNDKKCHASHSTASFQVSRNNVVGKCGNSHAPRETNFHKAIREISGEIAFRANKIIFGIYRSKRRDLRLSDEKQLKDKPIHVTRFQVFSTNTDAFRVIVKHECTSTTNICVEVTSP